MDKIILASKSPRRSQLLQWAEVDFEIVTQSTDELYPASLAIDEVPIYIAKQKALAVAQTLDGTKTVLAADTIVVLGDEVIGKPKDRADAIDILTRLSGNTHRVITGVYICNADKQISFSDSTDVHFHSLTHLQIEFYVDTYQPYDKAGAYGIQEWIGVVGIKNINGDFYNVMGLPVSRVVQALADF
jgi:septum formation protein